MLKKIAKVVVVLIFAFVFLFAYACAIIWSLLVYDMYALDLDRNYDM